MPYPFTEEQRRLRETLRRFALEEVIPGAAERDRTAAYPSHLVARLAELGLMGITVPEEYGGLGLETATQLVAVEEVAYGDAALASIYTGVSPARHASCVRHNGSPYAAEFVVELDGL